MTTYAPPAPAMLPPVQGAQIVYYQSGVNVPSVSLNRKAANVTGYMQLSFALASVIVGVLLIGLGSAQGYVAIPIWGGLGFYLVAGILGIIAANRGDRCSIIGCMIMSILSAVVAGNHFMWGISLTAGDYYYHSGEMAVNIISILIGFFEMITAIVASTYMCTGTACCCARSPPNTMMMSQAPGGPYIQSGQAVVQGYPMMQPIVQPMQYTGQPQVFGQPMQSMQYSGQPQVIGQPMQSMQYSGQAHGMVPQLPNYTENETKQAIPS